MKTRKLNITIVLPDDDHVQYKLEEAIYNTIGKENITDLRVLPNTDNLKENPMFKMLVKAEKKAKDLKYQFINEHLNK